MPFTPVAAPTIDLLQNAVDGDVFIPSFSRRSFLTGATGSLLSNAPPLTMVGNLLTVAAPVRNYDLNTFAGLGLSIETSVAAGNFPVVASRDVQVNDTASTGHTYTYPLSRQLGQLLVMAVATAALTTITTPSGWTLVQTQAGTESRTSIFTRVIDGTEPSTELLAFGTASGAVVRTWMIDIGDGPVEAVAGINDSAAGTSLDLAAISPTWAVTEATNNLYIAVLGLADDVAVSGFPAGYTVTGQDASASGTANVDCALAYAEFAALGSSENPGAFTYAASRATGHILAIKPKVTARLNWAGLDVRKTGSLVGTRRAINILDGTNITTTVSDNPGTGAVDITINASGSSSTPTWAQVLTEGNTSGANNPTISAGQHLAVPGGQGATGGDIRSATDLSIEAAVSVRITTNGVERWEVQSNGAWQVEGNTGTTGQYFRSTGAVAGPTWATIPLGDLAGINANTIVSNPTGSFAPPSTLAIGTNSIAARIAGNLVSHSLSTLFSGTLAYSAGVGSVNQAADFDWTGEHWFDGPVFFDDPTDVNIPSVGDIRGLIVTIHGQTQLNLATEAGSGNVNISSGLAGQVDIVGGDARLRASGGFVDVNAGTDGVYLVGGRIHVSSGTASPGAGGTLGGFLQIKGGSGSTPTVPANDGMFWVSDPGANPTRPRYTNDANVDMELLTDTALSTTITTTVGNIALASAANLDFDGANLLVNLTADGFIQAANSFSLIAGDLVTLDADGGVFVTGNGVVQIGSGATDGFLVFEGATASTPTVASGDGMFWVNDPVSGATQPFFTGDDNVDHELATTAHDCVAKGWCRATGNSTTILNSYNVTSVTDVTTGAMTCNWATDFSSANASAGVVGVDDTAGTTYVGRERDRTAGTLGGRCWESDTGTVRDPDTWVFIAFGDQ